MKNRLVIRLPQEVEGALLWGIWSVDQQQWLEQGELLSVDLVALAEKSTNCDTLVIVPANRVSQRQVISPAKQLKQIQQAVPYMLEEQLASPVDQLHFAYGSRKKSGELNVIWTTHDQMARWIEWFEQAEVKVDLLISELDLIGDANDAHEIILTGQVALISEVGGEKWSCQRDLLPLLWDQKRQSARDSSEQEIESKDKDDSQQAGNSANNKETTGESEIEEIMLSSAEHPVRIFHVGALEDFWAQREEVISQKLTETELLDTLNIAYSREKINILQNQYQPKKQSNISWSKYRGFTYIAIAALVTHLTYQGSSYFQATQELTVLQDQGQALFKRVFDRAPRGSNLLAQTQRLAKRSGGGSQKGIFLELLNAMSSQIQSAEEIRPTSITFDNKKNELRVDVLAPDYQTLNNFRDTLAANGLTVDMSSASAQGDKYSSRLVIGKGS